MNQNKHEDIKHFLKQKDLAFDNFYNSISEPYK